MACKTQKQGSKASIEKGSASPLVAGAARAAKDKLLKGKDITVLLDEDSLDEPLPHIPTNSIVIDRLIGGTPNAQGVKPCPGMPRGKMLQLYGEEGAGKSTLALEIAASTISSGGTVCYIDYENAIVPAYADALGVPVADRTKFTLVQPETLEQGLAMAHYMAQAGVDLIIFDSVGAGIPQMALSASRGITDEDQIGEIARVWSRFLPRMQDTITRTHTAVIGIAQTRAKISTGLGSHAPQTIEQGGKAWRFFAALRLRLSRRKIDKVKRVDRLTNTVVECVVGNQVEARLDKCKVSAQQGNKAIFYLRHGEGIDNYRTIIETAKAYNVIKASGVWLSWGELKAQGLENLRAELLATDGAFASIWQEVEAHLDAPPETKEEATETLADIMGGGQ